MSAAIVNSQNGPYFDHWSSILLDCIKNKKVKRIKNLLDALMNGVNMYNVDDCWFEYLDSNPPKTLDSESRSEMIYTILYWIYLLVNEEIKIRKLEVKEALTFLVKCKLHIFVSSILPCSEKPICFSDKNVFLALFVVKEILKLQNLKETVHTKELLEHSVIESLISTANKWKGPKLINVAAIDILFCFCMDHREACERIMSVEGHKTLALFIYKDWSEKNFIGNGNFEDLNKVGNKNMVYKVYQVEGCPSIELTHWKLPSNIDHEIACPLLISGFYARVFVLKIFTQIANMNNRFRLALYETLDVRQPVLGWLSTPSLGPSIQMMAQLSSYVIYNLMLNEDVAKKLVNENGLVDMLDTGLYNAGWHISSQYQMIVFAIAKHGGTLRDGLVKNKKIFEALINQLFSIDEDVHPRLMRLFEELSKGCKTANELHQAGFTPKLLINTGHYYAHSYQMDQIRKGFQKHVGSWRTEERKAIDKNPDIIVDNRQNVDRLKTLGNNEFQNENYSKALQLYTEAIDCCSLRIKCPDGKSCPSWNKELGDNVFHWWVGPATLFANRAQCYLKLKYWKEAVSDATKAICACWIPSAEGGPRREDIFLKATYRRARAWYELKDYHKALNDISCVCEHAPGDPIFKVFYKEVLLLHRKFNRRELIRHCGHCGAGEGIKLRRCADCFETYCSKVCQSKDWIEHKILCKQLKNRKE